MITLKARIRRAAEQLFSVTEYPFREAQTLLSQLLQCSREQLFIRLEDNLDKEIMTSYQQLILERCQGKPLAYLLQEKEFWSLPLTVTSDVLIPRPETELLVSLVLEFLPQNLPQKVLDLGTGSGAIAIALATERPNWLVTALDYSPKALQVAKLNAKHHHLTHLSFIQSDWFSGVSTEQFHAIVSNPPYVEDFLIRDSLVFEPRLALSGGLDGLQEIRKILTSASQFLFSGGFLLIEHGSTQQEAVKQLFEDRQFQEVIGHRDVFGNPRVVSGRWR